MTDTADSSRIPLGDQTTSAQTALFQDDADSDVRIWPRWFAIFAVATLLYVGTASQGIQWQDSGHFILRILDGQLYNPLGLALSHPIHFWLGRLMLELGLFTPCFAVTLVSSVMAAVACRNCLRFIAMPPL